MVYSETHATQAKYRQDGKCYTQRGQKMTTTWESMQVSEGLEHEGGWEAKQSCRQLFKQQKGHRWTDRGGTHGHKARRRPRAHTALGNSIPRAVNNSGPDHLQRAKERQSHPAGATQGRLFLHTAPWVPLGPPCARQQPSPGLMLMRRIRGGFPAASSSVGAAGGRLSGMGKAGEEEGEKDNKRQHASAWGHEKR